MNSIKPIERNQPRINSGNPRQTGSGLWIIPIALALMIAATGCATNKSSQLESYLTASGFKQLPATNAVQERQLQALPPGRITLLKHRGQVYYVYPDRATKRLFVGQRAQYENFQNFLGDAEDVADNRMVTVWQDWAIDPAWVDPAIALGIDGAAGFNF